MSSSRTSSSEDTKCIHGTESSRNIPGISRYYHDTQIVRSTASRKLSRPIAQEVLCEVVPFLSTSMMDGLIGKWMNERVKR